MNPGPPPVESQALSPEDIERIDGILQQAVAAHQQGRIEAAEAGYLEVLRLEPVNPDALNFLGVIALQRRDIGKSIELIGQAVAHDPEYAMAHFNLGAARIESKEPEQALLSIERGLALEPGYADGHFNRGIALYMIERWPDSIASFDRALELHPQHPLALYNRANALLVLKRHAEALSAYDRFLAVQPDHALAYAQRGDACLALGKEEQALDNYAQALVRQPDHVPALIQHSTLLLKRQRFEEAYAGYARAARLAPQDPSVHANLAVALRQLNRMDEALVACDRALALAPDLLEARMNRAGILFNTKRLDEAREALQGLVADHPDHAETHWVLGCCYLLQGDFEHGWPEFEWRLRKPDAPVQRGFAEPMWMGEPDLRGRTILLYAEEGLGDTIQFCRYAPMVAELGARVILEVHPALKSLVATLPGIDQVIARGQGALPSFDMYCPLMSLPLRFKTTLQTIPARVPYLAVDPHKLQAWSEVLGPRSGLRVGLAWSGNAAYFKDADRSIALAELLSACPAEVQLYSLQKDVREHDLQTLREHPQVKHFGDGLTDFTDTAALVSLMDVVVSVDTSVAHLAGALGKEAWVLQRWLPDWRWMLERSDTPWYPGMRLFRQTAARQWREPLEQIKRGLQQRA